MDSTNRQENLVAGVEARGNLGAGESDLSNRDLAVTRLATRRIENPNPVSGTVAAKRLHTARPTRVVSTRDSQSGRVPVRNAAPLAHKEAPLSNELASSVGLRPHFEPTLWPKLISITAKSASVCSDAQVRKLARRPCTVVRPRRAQRPSKPIRVVLDNGSPRLTGEGKT